MTSLEEQLSALPPEKRAEAEKLLAAYGEALERNPLWTYKPLAKQSVFHLSQRRKKLFVGGNRSGKTTAGIVDDLIQAVDEDCLPPHLKPFKKWKPPFRCRIVAPDFNETMEQVIFEKLREWVPRDQLYGGSWDKAYQKQKRRLGFANGSTFSFMTYEQDIDLFRGAALHRVHFDEEPEGEQGRSLFKENWKRLTDFRGDFVLTMTPEHGMSWVYDDFFEPVENHEQEPGVYDNGEVFVIQADLDENPHIGDEEKAELLSVFTDEERAAAKSGHFVNFHGLVYGEWKEDLHLVEPVSSGFLKDKSVYVGIDPGLKRCAVVFCALDGENDMLVFDELYLPDPTSLPENAVKAIRQKEAWWGVKPDLYLIDPAARIRDQIRAETIQTAYVRAGLPVVPAQNEVEPGCTEIKRRLQSKPPAFLVTRNCQNWRAERKRYRFKPNEDGSFEVVKVNDHLMDATRYVAMARPWGGGSSPSQPEEFNWTPGEAPDFTELERTINTPSPPLGSMT